MPGNQRTSSIVDRVLFEMHCFVSKQVNSIHTSFIGEDSEGYSGKSLQASIMWMKKASQPQLHSKAESEPALPLFFFTFYLPNGHILARLSIFDYSDRTRQSKVSQT
jgi:hypothetical protein